MFAEDLSIFFDTTSGFAQQATLNGVALVGIFDAPSANFDMLAGSSPTFQCQSAAVPSDPRGLSLVVASVSYTVREYTHDGTGLCVLKLEAA